MNKQYPEKPGVEDVAANKRPLSGWFWITIEIVGVLLLGLALLAWPRPAVALQYITPVAIDDSYTTTTSGTIDTVAAGLPGVLDNDMGQPLTAVLVDDVVNGSLVLDPAGSFTYAHSGNSDLSFTLDPGLANSLLEYGVATALDGDTLVVGANSHEQGQNWAGAAYVYRRLGVQWQFEAKLVPNDPAASHFFGWSVDVAGDTVVVGAIGDSGSRGAVYVFDYVAGNWLQQAKLTAGDGATQDKFGAAVTIEGDTLVATAHLHNHAGHADAGAAYVFLRQGGSWSQQAKLTAADPGAGDWFGLGLALDGDRLAVGAPYADANASDGGAVYVFGRNGINWSQEAKLTASDATAKDTFGFSVALQGSTLAVGANSYMDTQAGTGAVYLFEETGSGWNEITRLAAPNASNNRLFRYGISVAMEEDTLLVGSHDQPTLNRGTVYRYVRDGISWLPDGKLTSLQPNNNEYFGTQVAISDGLIAVSANSSKFHPSKPDNKNGAAYVYQTGGSLIDSFTYVADDGLNQSNVAVVSIYLGNTSTPPTITQHPADLTVTAPAAATFSVQASGDPPLTYQWRRDGANISGATSSSYTLNPTDVTDDGAQFDVIVSNTAGSVTSQPATLTVEPPPPPEPPTITEHPADLTVTAPAAATFSVQASGSPPFTYQWRRDGANIPGATNSTYTLDPTDVTDNGAQFDVIVSNTAGSATSQPATLTVEPPNLPPIAANDVYTVGSSGIIDTVQQGVPGVLANDSDPEQNPLSALLVEDVQHGTLTLAADGSFVYVPDSSGTAGQELIPGSHSLVEYGVATAVEGDTLVVGANSHESGRTWAGAVYVFTRQGDNWVLQARLTADRPGVGQFFGWDVDLSGDTLVVGAPGDRKKGTQAGAAYVFTRNGSTWSLQAQLVGLDTAAYDEFAVSVDINGNTIAIGSYLHDQSGNDAGAAYVFTRSGSTWSQQAKIVPTDLSANAWFGAEVALDNETLAVGAIHGGPAGKGATYLFTRSGTNWSQQAKVSASDGTAGDTFGFALALQGDTLVASATAYQSGSGFPGAAYIFKRNGVTWSEQQKLTPADVGGDTTFGFGASVAIDGQTILVGADGDNAMAVDAGSVYVYQWNGTAWAQQEKLYSPDPTAGEAFGAHVSLHDTTFVTGANSEKFSPVPDGALGAAYVFTSSAVLSDSFTYRASDGVHHSNLATVFIIIESSTGPAASANEAHRPVSANRPL